MQEVLILRINAQLHFLPLILGNQPFFAQHVIKEELLGRALPLRTMRFNLVIHKKMTKLT